MPMTIPTWSRFRSVGYLTGAGVAWGCAGQEIIPKRAMAEGKFCLQADILRAESTDICGNSLGVVADASLQYGVVGPNLRAVQDDEAMLGEVVRKVGVGGHLVMVMPLSPPERFHYHHYTPAGLRRLVEFAGSWVEKAFIERDGWVLGVWKKIRGGRGITPRRPTTKPRACIARYGAIGDLVMVTPLIRRLAEDGYEVTLNITPYAAAVVEQNPFVGNVILQERDAIPNHLLGEYWKEWQGDYDRYINLSESIEGKLLRVEGRRDYYTPQAWRAEQGNQNYYDVTMERGGYPEVKGVRGELFFTPREEREMKEFRERHRGKFLVMWALNGSSHHKAYPLMEKVLRDWLATRRDAVVVTVGDYAAKLLEFEHPQVVPAAGQWPLRRSLAFTKFADLVVGPETAMLNAAGCFPTPKIPLLSHSTHEMLCKHFQNDYCLAPDPRIAPCHPCYQLHYSLDSCPLARIVDEQTGEVLCERVPACAAGAISGERMISRLEQVYQHHYLPTLG